MGETKIPKAVVKAGEKAIASGTDVAGAVGGVSKLIEAGSKAGAGAINKKYNQGNAQALSGGNTVQIPIIFFMFLAIFNN